MQSDLLTCNSQVDQAKKLHMYILYDRGGPWPPNVKSTSSYDSAHTTTIWLSNVIGGLGPKIASNYMRSVLALENSACFYHSAAISATAFFWFVQSTQPHVHTNPVAVKVRQRPFQSRTIRLPGSISSQATTEWLGLVDSCLWTHNSVMLLGKVMVYCTSWVLACQ